MRLLLRTPMAPTLSAMALAALLATSTACAPVTSGILTGVGCDDPHCASVLPETRTVLGCIGDVCNQDPQAVEQAASARPDTTTTGSSTDELPAPRSQAQGHAALSDADGATAEAEDDEKDGDVYSLWGLKVKYERPSPP